MIRRLRFWLASPVNLAGLLALGLLVTARTQSYLKSFWPGAWAPNIQAFLNEKRPLDFVLADHSLDPPGAFKLAWTAYATPSNQRFPVERGFKYPDYFYQARGRVLQWVDAVPLPPGAQAPLGRGQPYASAALKWPFWLLQLLAAFGVTAAVKHLWARLLGTLLGFTVLEMLRLWDLAGYGAALAACLAVGGWSLWREGRGFFPVLSKYTGFAALLALPCVTLALQALAHPVAHWDAMAIWLPRAALIAKHNTIFFKYFYPAMATMPENQGYPPAWPSLLSVFWSFLPQLGFIVAPLLLGLLIGALTEHLFLERVPWPYVAAAAWFLFTYLQEFAGYGYAEVLTAAAVFMLCLTLLRWRDSVAGLSAVAILAFLLPNTREESILYAGVGLVVLLWLKVPWNRLAVAAGVSLAGFAAWKVVALQHDFWSQSRSVASGLGLLFQRSLGEWLARAGAVLQYLLLRWKVNAEHYFVLVVVLACLLIRPAAARWRFLSRWQPMGLYVALMVAVLMLLYLAAPAPTVAELKLSYLSTGFERMYSHFLPIPFLLLPFVAGRGGEERL